MPFQPLPFLQHRERRYVPGYHGTFRSFARKFKYHRRCRGRRISYFGKYRNALVFRQLQQRVGIDGWQPVLLRMGVELPAARATLRDGDELRLVTPASLFPVKGHRYLIEALAGLERVSLDVAGEGHLRAELESQARGLPVAFLGAVSHPGLLTGLSEGRWDAVVLPSVPTPEGDQEGVPVSLIEAMAAGVPVVSTECGAIPELVSEGSGLLVPPADPAALRAALERLRDPELRRRLATAGRARVETEFDVDRVAARLAELFAGC